jgi:tRNA U34 5-carboxymethylaminomethyl modifying GTPase MnmE/TrmE
VGVVDNDVKIILEHIKGDISDLKKVQEKFLELMRKYTEMEANIDYQTKRADEGRKVLWKRLDSQQRDIEHMKSFQSKVLYTVATSSIALLVAILFKGGNLI